MSSLVTDAPLPVGTPIDDSRCGGCTVCVAKCPGKALTGVLWNRDRSREELFRKEALLGDAGKEDERGHGNRDGFVRTVLRRMSLYAEISETTGVICMFKLSLKLCLEMDHFLAKRSDL